MPAELKRDWCTGLVLAGGKSKRMNGMDKTLFEIDGRTMISRIVDTISPVFTEVVIASGEADRFEGLSSLRQIADATPGIGPIAGIRAGLAAARTDWVFAVAADMPMIDLAIVRRVLDGCDSCHHAVVPRIGDRLEPLHAAYRKDIVPTIDAFIGRGELRMRMVLREIPVRWIDLDEGARPFFFNVNRPDDLDKVGGRAAGPEGRAR